MGDGARCYGRVRGRPPASPARPPASDHPISHRAMVLLSGANGGAVGSYLIISKQLILLYLQIYIEIVGTLVDTWKRHVHRRNSGDPRQSHLQETPTDACQTDNGLTEWQPLSNKGKRCSYPYWSCGVHDWAGGFERKSTGEISLGRAKAAVKLRLDTGTVPLASKNRQARR